MIPDQILREAEGLVPDRILEEILEKLVSVFRNRIETSCSEDVPQRYVTSKATPHLVMMQSLGLVEKDPIHKPGCNCAPEEKASMPYGLTEKAWRWFVSYAAANRTK